MFWFHNAGCENPDAGGMRWPGEQSVSRPLFPELNEKTAKNSDLGEFND
jgi:hypothetical protein